MKTNRRIPRALINSPEELLQQKIQDRYDYSNRKLTNGEETSSYPATEKALLKYYPKYCHTIRLDYEPKSRSVVSRVKQIKSIRHFEYHIFYSKSLILKKLKNLLANKRKSLKSMPIAGFEEELACRIRHLTPMEMCHFFPQIETLKVRLEVWNPSNRAANRDFISASLERKILSAYGHFWQVLRHVKHLDLDFNPNLWMILPHLQKYPRFLSSLQSFRLTLMFHRIDSTDTPRKKLLIYLRTPDVLKYVTHINFQRFDRFGGQFHYYGDQIKSILDYCSRLQSIIFPIESELYHSQTQFANPKHYLTQAPLKSLNKLSSIDLMVYDVWSLMKGFEFPPQLKRLALRLYDLDPIVTLFKTNKDDEKSQEEEEESLDQKREILVKFFEKISRLNELKVLELNTRILDGVLEEIFVPMLQAVPKLEKLEFHIYTRRPRHRARIPLNLSLILNETLHFTHLKSFKVSKPVEDDAKLSANYHQIITFTSQARETLSLPNLTFVNIDAVVSEDFDFRAFFTAFSEGSNQKEINLAKIRVLSIQSLLRLFKIFKEAEQSSNLKISLELVLNLKNWEDIDKYLEEMIISAKNVTIHLRIEISSSGNTKPPAERIMKLQKVFAKMKFTLTLIAEKKRIKMVSQ